MPEILTTCTRCRRQLRVPEEMQGRMVKCPACEFTFTIAREGPPPPSAPARSEAPFLREDSETPGERSDSASPLHPAPDSELAEADRRDRLRTLLKGPAIGLILLGLVGLYFCTDQAIKMHKEEDKIREQTIQVMRNFMGEGDQALRAQMDVALPIAKVLSWVFVVISLITVAAGAQMMRLRTYWLAVAGSILAMLNLVCCLCVPGLAVGIWALVLLFRPGTSSLFYS